MQKLELLSGGTLGNFLLWVNDPEGGNVYPNTVVSIVEGLRDTLVAEHQITVEEVIAR